MRPRRRIVRIGLGASPLVEPLGHVLGRHQVLGAVGPTDDVERAGQGALGRGAVVADDVVDEGVVQDVQLLQGVDEAADVVVGELQVAGVVLHLPGQDGLEVGRLVVPGRDLLWASGQVAVGGDDAELLLAGGGLLPHPVPALVEVALVLVGPLFGHVVGVWVAPGAK
jgi:hypothetical protein